MRATNLRVAMGCCNNLERHKSKERESHVQDSGTVINNDDDDDDDDDGNDEENENDHDDDDNDDDGDVENNA